MEASRIPGLTAASYPRHRSLARHRGLELVLLLAAVLLIGCGGADSGEPSGDPADASVEPVVFLSNLSAEERNQFYHLSQGAELIPYDLFWGLERADGSGPIHQDLERFGFVRDDSHEQCLPVGLTVSKPADGPPMIGFTCSVCHVGELTYRGTRYRIDGGPNPIQPFVFQDALVRSLEATLEHPTRAWRLLHAHGRSVDGCQPGDAPDIEPPELDEAAYREARATIHAELAPQPDGSHIDRAHDRYRESVSAFQGDEGGGWLRRLWALEARIVTSYRHFHDPTLVETTDPGPGRADAWGAVRNVMFEPYDMTAPQDIPNLWGFHDIEWLHWFANTNSSMQRDLAESIGFGALYDRRDSWTSARLDNLARINELAAKIEKPEWPDAFPEIDAARSQRGGELFAEHCAGCHEGRRPDQPNQAGGFEDYVLVPLEEIGLDPTLAENYSRPLTSGEDFANATAEILEGIEERYIEQEGLDPSIQTTWAQGRGSEKWRSQATGYVARSLDGVWATAPFFHNGSVPTLFDLLHSPDCANQDPCRPARFGLGHREFDPERVGPQWVDLEDAIWVFDVTQKGNSNQGHEHGWDLSAEEKLDLVEFLKGY